MLHIINMRWIWYVPFVSRSVIQQECCHLWSGVTLLTRDVYTAATEGSRGGSRGGGRGVRPHSTLESRARPAMKQCNCNCTETSCIALGWDTDHRDRYQPLRNLQNQCGPLQNQTYSYIFTHVAAPPPLNIFSGSAPDRYWNMGGFQLFVTVDLWEVI